MKRHFIRALIILLLICYHPGSIAQNQKHRFAGKVLDRSTRAAIPRVNISVEETVNGCSTNQAGDFSLVISRYPAFVRISHLGYESQRLWLDSTTISMTILLNPSGQMLGEVEIKAYNKPMPFFQDTKYSVLDYAVVNDLVYLLIYRFRLNKSELLCKTLDGDTVAFSGRLPVKPTGLFLDCLGNLHVQSADSDYQVFRDKKNLELCYAVDMNRFRSILANCVASTDSLLFFRKESPDQLSVVFYQINRVNSKMDLLSFAGDDKKMKMLRRNPGDYRFLLMHSAPRDPDDVLTWQWLKKIVYRKNNSSLKRIGDFFCLFNTSDYTVELFTLNGELSSRLKIPVQDIPEGKWTTEIYVNDEDQKAYTSFQTKGGNFTLYRIDLNTGELRHVITADHAFPQKVSIHKRAMYYIYDTPGEGDNQRLYRIKL